MSGLPACAQSPDCFREDVFCAALVTDTRGLNDFGPNQNAWAGLQNSHAEGVTDQVAYIESVDAKDYEKNITFFADAGYDVIVTSSIGLQNATLRQADLHPDSVFVGLLQTDTEARANFIPVTFPEDHMGFLAGALAARLTETGIVGAACETSGIDAMWRYCEGFSAGAKFADESVEVLIEYREEGSRDRLFIDPDWGAEAAYGLIGTGADVVFAAGGETAAGALRAASAAGVRVIGAERDQAAALAESGLGVVTSVLGRTSFTVQELMRNIKAGAVADAQVGPVMFVSLDGRVAPGLANAAAEWLKGLENGEIMTNVTKKKP
jgi:basic membrane protein A and related proteins